MPSPLVPISITRSHSEGSDDIDQLQSPNTNSSTHSNTTSNTTDDTNNTNEQPLLAEKIRNRQVPAPPVPPRVPSRGYNTHLRASRATSLIIPVVTNDHEEEEEEEEEEDNEKRDIVDFNVNMSLPSSPVSPKLPTRPPKTPDRKNSSEFQPQVLTTYGLDRVTGANFSPTSMNSKRSRKSSFKHFENDHDDHYNDYEPSLIDKIQKFYIQSRKSHVDEIIEILSNQDLTISGGEYLDKIHSSDSIIETLSQIRAGDYESTNLPILYSLLLKSLKIEENTFNFTPNVSYEIEKEIDQLIIELSFLLRSTNEQKLKLKNDFMKIYTLLLKTNITNTKPNALVLSFMYRCGSKYVLPQTLILALIINKFILPLDDIDSQQEFKFILLRTLESIDPTILLNITKQSSNPISYTNELLQSTKFWCDLVHQLYINDTNEKNHPYGLTKVLHNLIVYGIYSLIDVIIHLRHELNIFGCDKSNKQDTIDISSQNNSILNYHREFTILNESIESKLTSNELEKLSNKNQELEKVLEEHNKGYNELLNNYKQLNEEKISVTGLIDKVKDENETLKATKRSINAQVEQALSQYDVIKQTMEKNKRVQELNDSMKKEIERLVLENKRLSK